MKGYHYIKRGIDIILSGMAIVILSPPEFLPDLQIPYHAD